jgi:hypothetical protein
MPTEEDRRLAAELVEARKTLFALQSEIEHPTVSRLHGTQVELFREYKSVKDECRRLHGALETIRKT